MAVPGELVGASVVGVKSRVWQVTSQEGLCGHSGGWGRAFSGAVPASSLALLLLDFPAGAPQVAGMDGVSHQSLTPLSL